MRPDRFVSGDASCVVELVQRAVENPGVFCWESLVDLNVDKLALQGGIIFNSKSDAGGVSWRVPDVPPDVLFCIITKSPNLVTVVSCITIKEGSDVNIVELRAEVWI